MKADVLTESIIRMGMDTDWEMELIEATDGRILIVNLDTCQVHGEVNEPGDVLMYERPRPMAEYQFKEEL